MGLLRSREDLEIVAWPEDRKCERSWLLDKVAGATGAIVMLSDKIDEEFFESAGPSLKVVSTTSVGFEHVDLRALHRRKIRLGYTPDVLTDAVADASVMLALMAGRNAGAGVTLVKEGKWPDFNFAPFFFTGPQLSTSALAQTRTVGFLGFGRIAQVTLARLAAFNITHCIYSSNPTSARDPALDAALAARHGLQSVRGVELDELARESDVLFVLAPGGEKTRHVINAEFLRKMKKHAVLVNTARGTLVDSDALAQALREEWIWAAGLDVVENEPHVDADHPLVKEPRCVIVPHIGSATFETRLGMVSLAAQNALAGIDGEAMPAELDVGARLATRL
ncbi:D-isomer specific 2-hydroxyacid dehydrogenase [Gloeopeniophorella convolvens]|nr:D-isomer specific 2-hydroxyacid dehydrogenase [Gloeopeniophorella convolvens]